MSEYYSHYSQQWLKQHKSVLSKRYNKPKKYSGSEKFVNGEFIAHTHLRENMRRKYKQPAMMQKEFWIG